MLIGAVFALLVYGVIAYDMPQRFPRRQRNYLIMGCESVDWCTGCKTSTHYVSDAINRRWEQTS